MRFKLRVMPVRTCSFLSPILIPPDPAAAVVSDMPLSERPDPSRVLVN